MTRFAALAFFLLLTATACGADLADPDLANTDLADTGLAKTELADQEKPIEDFRLRTIEGQDFALSDLKPVSYVVIAFVGVDCPLAKLYGSRLEKLAAEYKTRGVQFVGIDSNAQDSMAEIKAYARVHGIGFPVLKDPGNKVADALRAERTPEVFVLDAQRVVRYRGRVDDQYAIGTTRPEPKQHDLRRALDELIAGRPISQPRTETQGCLIGKTRSADASSPVTYHEHIAPLIERHCLQCHRPGQVGPFSLTDFSDVAGWAEMIDEVVADGRMPPWHANPRIGHFAGERRLSTAEKELIKTWVASGAPRGNPPKSFDEARVSTDIVPTNTVPSEVADAARLPADDWQLPSPPDLVIPMRSSPFSVPAQGPIDYQYFKVDPGFQEDRWISAAEVMPGNRTVVHHAVVHAVKGNPLDALTDGTTEGYLAVFVPGMRATPLPPRMAKRIAAGSQLIFQVHYTPNGAAQTDCCKLGLVFANPADVDFEVFTSSVAQRSLSIPPGAAHYRAMAKSSRAPSECRLLSMMPHMHLRGASFTYELLMPGGKREMLLDVPKYDCNWQTDYRLIEPRLLPTGSQLRCVAHFDNSENNLSNPDPTATVQWGMQTSDEMMVGYFDVALPKGRKPPPPLRSAVPVVRPNPAAPRPGVKPGK